MQPIHHVHTIQAVCLLLGLMCVPCSGMIEGLYCGTENCYDVLGITSEATKSEIVKAYRALARKWHPDMHKTKKDKATEMFQKIANAHEILKDEDSRKDYDYYLEHPEEYYSHYFRYYRTRMAPKVDVRIVIVVTITVLSVIQYWSAWNNYNKALDYLVTVPKYKLQAVDIAKKEGLLGVKKKKDRLKTKEELRQEEEDILKKVIEEKVDIKGGYKKPKISDILWLQLVLSPVYLIKYIYWYFRWVWLFWIKREEYGIEEKEYLIKKNMKLKKGQWEAFDDHETEAFFTKELWITENFKEWKMQKQEEMKADLAQNSRYKMYRRYMKKGGAGQMSFGPE